MLVVQPVAADVDDRGERDLDPLVRRRDAGEQPVNGPVVRELVDEFVDDAVDAHGARDELEGGVGRVVVHEVVLVEVGEGRAADSACELWVGFC